MSKNKITAGVAAVLAAIGLGVGIASCTGPSPKSDGDFKSNCWAHVDANGSRHCASAVAPRFGFKH